MFSKTFSRLCTNRSLVKETLGGTSRAISKTPSTSNSDAIGTAMQMQASAARDWRNDYRISKWEKLNRHNNNRALSTIQTKGKQPPPAAQLTIASKEEAREFMALFPDMVRDLTEAAAATDIPGDVTKRHVKALQYNVPTGKKVRGLAVVATYKTLETPENLTEDSVRLANVAGWCVEMLQAFFLVLDDLVDKSELRRGVPCWYRKEDVGLTVVNDALLLENGIYTILRKYFSGKPCYTPMMELFHDITLKTTMGQTLDCLTSKDGKPNLELFTMKRYNNIVKYKTAYYSFQLPVALAMYLSGKFDPEMHRQAKTILLEMGHFFQVQDDFLDCFGNTELTGKTGSDIREGKCSWLAVVALQRATPKQRKILEEHLGNPNPESEAIVRNLYEELSLPNTYAIYEEETYNLLKTHIQQLTRGLPHKLFFKFLDRIYLREA